MNPASLHPVFLVIVFFQTADDDSFGGAGMDELVVFEVDAHVCHTFGMAGAAEEDKVACLQFAFAYFQAVSFHLFGAARH